MLGGQSSNVTCSSGQVFGSARTLKPDGISGFIWASSSIESNHLSKKEKTIPPWCWSCEDCCSLFPSAFSQACCISCYHGDLAFCADWVDMFPLQYRQRQTSIFCQLVFSVCKDFFQLVIISHFYKILLDGNLIAVTWKLHSFNWCFENKASFFGGVSTSLI